MSEWNRRTFLKASAAAGFAALPSATDLSAERFSTGRPTRGRTANDPLGIRDQFPVTEDLAYLNTASMGPLPIPVYEALTAYAEEKMMYRAPGTRRATLERARTRFADLFGAGADEIALLYSTSDGENLVAHAIDWRPGDNVVIDELHFVTAFVVFRELERRESIELRIVPVHDGRARLEDYESQIDDRTRLVSVAWVSNRNGYRHDLPSLAELAHSHGAYLYADAIQALGTFPTVLRDEGVDFACGNGYKWLFADFGCAPFFVRREHLEWMRPDRWGHAQVSRTLPGYRYELDRTAEVMEYANAAYGPVAAMDAALEFVAGVGLDRIAEHTHGLAAELRKGAEDLGRELFTPADNPSPIVSFYHGLEPETLAEALVEEGVRFSFQEEGRLLRAAVAMFNTRDDVDRLLGVIARLV